MIERRANISGMSAIVIWFATPLMLAFTGQVPPFLVGAFSYLLSFALVLAYWVYKGDNIARHFKMPLKAYALGIYGIALYNMLYIFSIKHGPLLEVNLINYLWPAFLIIFSAMLQKVRPDNYAIVGIVCCFFGCYFVFASRGAISFEGNHLMLFAGLVCAVMWASYSSLIKYIHLSSEHIAVFFLIAGVIMLAMHLLLEETLWPATAFGWSMLVAYALSRIAFFMWNYAMKHGTTRLLSSLSYFIPLFATISLSWAGFLHYSPTIVLGAALIIGGCIIINLQAIMGGAGLMFRRVFAWQ